MLAVQQVAALYAAATLLGRLPLLANERDISEHENLHGKLPPARKLISVCHRSATRLSFLFRRTARN
jgi:hypothetical protein